MVVFTFSALDQKYSLWANLIKKVNIVSLSWNLVFSLIRMHRFQWWCSVVSVLDRKYTFCGNSDQESKNSLKNINSNKQNSMVVFTFSILDCKYHFWANLVKKVKIVSLNWNLAPTIKGIYRVGWWCLLLNRKYSF